MVSITQNGCLICPSPMLESLQQSEVMHDSIHLEEKQSLWRRSGRQFMEAD